LFQIIKGPLLAPLDIFVSRNFCYQRMFHLDEARLKPLNNRKKRPRLFGNLSRKAASRPRVWAKARTLPWCRGFCDSALTYDGAPAISWAQRFARDLAGGCG
jgi:hypothetical protein